MSATDDDRHRPRRPRRTDPPDLGVLTPPSIPRVGPTAVPGQRSTGTGSAPPPADPPADPPARGRSPARGRPTARELRNRAAATGRRVLLLTALCLVAGASPQLPAPGRRVLAAVVLAGLLRLAQVWRRAFRRRREERAETGTTTWPGAEDLARP